MSESPENPIHLHLMVGSVVDSLEHRDCNRHGLNSKPTRAILFCLWEKHFLQLVVLGKQF